MPILSGNFQSKIAESVWRIGSTLQDAGNVNLLVGAPRSGTTWALQLFETLPGTRRIWEPFLPSTINHCNFGLGWRPYLSADEKHSALEAYFEALISGSAYDFHSMVGPLHMSKKAYFMRIIVPSRTIIKSCRAQRLLPWLNRRIPIKTLLLIRHPLAVISSQLHHPAFQDQTISDQHPVVTPRVSRDWPELTEYALQLTHLEEKLAATWCFDYLIPFSNWHQCENALLVTYEDLLTNSRNELSRIEDHFCVDFSALSYDKLTEPSMTSDEDQNSRYPEKYLSKWKEHLSREQCDRVLGVVKNFGLSFYDTDVMPNKKRIYEFLRNGQSH